MNKIIVTGTLIIIILIIGIPTYINIRKDHEEKELNVVKKRISEAAKKCFLEEKCQGSSTTLEELYNNDYLEEQTNPTNKKLYEPSSKITYEKGKINLDLK